MTEPEQRTAQPTPITIDTALAHASRLLLHAEVETDRGLMERLEKLADSWISIANTVLARERG